MLVSTLHNSEGHEFRAVFILGLTDGSIPYVTSHEPEEMEREAALFMWLCKGEGLSVPLVRM